MTEQRNNTPPRNGFLAYAVVLVLVAAILYLTQGQWNEFENIRRIQVGTAVALSALFLLSQVFSGYMLRLSAQVFGIHLRPVEWIGLTCIQSFGNFLPLHAGMVSNAAYLKLKRGLPLTRYANLATCGIVIMTMTYSSLGLILLLVRPLASGSLQYLLVGGFLLLLLAGLGMIFLPLGRHDQNHPVMKGIVQFQEGWEIIRSHRPLLLSLSLLQMGILFCIALQFKLIFRDLGVGIDIFSVMILSLLTNMLRFSALLPGNLGVREVVIGGVTKSLGLLFSTGILVALISRIISMFWIFLLGTIFSLTFVRWGRMETP